MKKLKRILNKDYFKNNQHMYIINCYEDQQNMASIYLSDKKGKFKNYLFSIRTLDDCFYIDYYLSYFKKSLKLFMNDVVEASNTPLYMDRVFTIKKFAKLTEKDIMSCTKYFLRDALDCWLIFNITLKK